MTEAGVPTRRGLGALRGADPRRCLAGPPGRVLCPSRPPRRPPGRGGAAVQGGGPPVTEGGVAPPGPIPNPVVPHASAAGYCGLHAVGDGAVAGGPPHPHLPSPAPNPSGAAPPSPPHRHRGVEQRQLVGLITRRPGVRIPPPLLLP